MKKRKLGLILNIATLCLSICAIVVGVYAIRNASINVSGSIGFVSHGVKLNIQSYMYGYSDVSSGVNPIEENNKVQLTKDGGLNIDGSIGSINLGATKGEGNVSRYFSDINGSITPIRVELKIVNNSGYEVLLEDSTSSSSNFTIICDDPLRVLYATTSGTKSKEATIIYTLLPAKDDDGNYKEIKSPVNVSLSMSFSSIETNIAGTNFTFDNTNSNVLTGVPTIEQNGGSDTLIIPSTFSTGETIDTLGVTNNYVAITNAKNYKKIVVLDGITTMGVAPFYECSKMESVCLPDSVTTISDNAFQHCDGLKAFATPKDVTRFSIRLNNGAKLLSLKLPDNLAYLYVQFSNMFEIDIPNKVTSLTLNHFPYLKSIELPNGLKSLDMQDCPSLTSVVIPDSMTSLSDMAFWQCKNLKQVQIPNTVKSFGAATFNTCPNLKDINYLGTKEQWNAITKPSSWDYDSGDYTVHCTDGDILKA